MTTINASQFKAKCLAILDQVAASGETITILKRGKPVARLVPPAPSEHRYPQHALYGSVTLHDDLVEPPLPADAWAAERGKMD